MMTYSLLFYPLFPSIMAIHSAESFSDLSFSVQFWVIAMVAWSNTPYRNQSAEEKTPLYGNGLDIPSTLPLLSSILGYSDGSVV
jgi:hypothetical protein